MAKKDDYTYPDDVVTPEEYPEAAESKQTENLQSMLMNKRMMIPAGIIGAVFLVNIIFGEDTNTQTAEAPAPEVAVAEPVPVPVESPQVAQIDRHAELLNANSKALDNVVESHSLHKQELSKSKERFDGLAGKVDELATDVAILHNELRNNNQTLAVLSARIADLSKPKPKPKPAVKKAPVVLKNFSIRAVIDGRAWIRNDKDAANTLSVSVGDSIPTYGRVTAIHPTEGLIQTTSGRVIQFPADER